MKAFSTPVLMEVDIGVQRVFVQDTLHQGDPWFYPAAIVLSRTRFRHNGSVSLCIESNYTHRIRLCCSLSGITPRVFFFF